MITYRTIGHPAAHPIKGTPPPPPLPTPAPPTPDADPEDNTNGACIFDPIEAVLVLYTIRVPVRGFRHTISMLVLDIGIEFIPEGREAKKGQDYTLLRRTL